MAEEHEGEPESELETDYVVDEQGRYFVPLPCGKTIQFRPIHPAKIRRILEAFQQPEVPKRVIEVPGSGMGQPMPNPSDPQYVRDLETWFIKLQGAQLTRFVCDALIVPEEADYNSDDGKPYIAMPDCPKHKHLGKPQRWLRMGFKPKDLEDTKPASECTCQPCEDDWAAKLREMQVPVPQEGCDRNWAYVEEAYEELLGGGVDQYAFIQGVRAASIPTEAAIRRARRNFRNAMAQFAARGPQTAEG